VPGCRWTISYGLSALILWQVLGGL